MKNNGQVRLWRISILLIISIIISSCDMGSYNPIARALDPFEPLGTNSLAWMNTSGSTGDSKSSFLILQEGVPSDKDQGGYIYIEIADNSFPSPKTEIRLIRGIYSISSSPDGVLNFLPHAEYLGIYRQTSSPSNNPDPIDREGEIIKVDFSYNSSSRELSLGDEPEVFSPIQGSGGILDSIFNMTTAGNAANSTAIRAMQLQLIYQVGIFASQVIVPGFGGTGMMTYYNNRTPFQGLVGGKESILMSKLLPLARVDFDYDEMVNLPGLSMSGKLRTDSNASGTGSMSQLIDTVVNDGTNPPYSFSVSYDGIKITGTIPSDGSYTVSIDGSPEDISFMYYVPGNLDFTGILSP